MVRRWQATNISIILTSHSMLAALSWTLAGFTDNYIVAEQVTSSFATADALTLGSGVKPVMGHSSTSYGASSDETFDASTNGSLIILTTNSFVARIFSRESLGIRGDNWNETLIRGGLWLIYINMSIGVS